MNRFIIIALGALLVIGIGYQGKRMYDAKHGSNATASLPNGTSNTSKSSDTTHVGDTQNGAAVGANSDSTHSVNGVAGTQATHDNGVNSPAQTGNQSGSMSNGSANGNATAAGTIGSSGVHMGTSSGGTAEKSDQVATAPVKEKPKDNCFAFEYRHKKEARSQDIEDFLDYTNAFPIKHENFNPKSVCVKVNQKAVNFQLAKNKAAPEVRVGSMVGPESVIRVSYCVGKVPLCHESCDQPKKRFMDDLMSDASDDDSFSDSWGKDENHKKELKNKAKELRAIASENDHLNEGSIQRNWDELQKQEWVCK